VVGSRHIADAIISKVQEIQAELRKPSEKKEDEKATETVDAEAPKAEIVNDAKKPSVFSRLKSALKTPFVSVKQSHSESSNRKEVVSALREDLLTLGELRRLYNWNDLLFTSEQLDAKYGVERPGRPKSTDKIEEKAEEKAAA
jgi:hypothetical protein